MKRDIYTISCPCHFGLEAPLKREIYDLGYDITEVTDGRVTFTGDAEAICRANIHLRVAERVLVEVGRFHATTFEELFQGIKALPWEDFIPKDGKFWVTKATSVKSKLFSLTDIQSIVKKAMVERMKSYYDINWFEETGAEYPVRIFLLKDDVVVTLDSTGTPLHKRGYRTYTSKAPLSETMAAALIQLTPWRADRILVDPFCGSGTFLIEAAMIAANIAPGLNREFTSMDWDNLIDQKTWKDCFDEARADVDTSVECDLQGYDIDPEMVKIARLNAKQAGVDHMIHFQARDVADLHHPKKFGFILTNPPYGERLEEKKDLPELYGNLGKAFASLDSWSMYVITSYEDAPKSIGRKADKNRKIYNGMIKTYFYQFLGPKPTKKKD
ncbi:THUMP domain-containing class I SAM-dependent RNA methyltransferase [Pseudobutyrivibrio ruminis]|uniref:THUMP domain-containing class I SAM-dependent RNA methyltransferase n=1 Tax=Pseudobutyrivibrio ruminis TaxID=46206 RepID=UPI00041F8178|nr:class I SAM-dependent RNA methyltransferase [Pseudobutyrivibrio ruminis]